MLVRNECGESSCVRAEHSGFYGAGSRLAFKDLSDRIHIQTTRTAGGCLVVQKGNRNAVPRTIYWQGKSLTLARAVWTQAHGPLPGDNVVTRSLL
ncbi:hypothetical protein [Streptomyces sp. NPDC048442]|uniref:hypothetical protein n=1 Tax=Streptomyces sp. NPDC048442 TaxID=3154823 RepID=UPI00343B324F